MSDLVQLTIDGDTATITLNRPEKHNSLNPAMISDFEALLGALETNKDVRFVFLTGAGERAFCSGADLAAFSEQDRDSVSRSWIPNGHRIFRRLAQLPQITFAVLNGNAFGGGLELALACDFRVASSAAKIALPEVTIGTLPGWAGSSRLVDAIGFSRAKYMLLSGSPIDALTASSWGLVHEVAPQAELMDAAKEFAAKFRKAGPVAQRLGKQLISAFENKTNSEVLEAFAGALTATTEDLAEGIQSFREKRSTNFPGR